MERKRRTFDAGFKLRVARMVRHRGPSVGRVCRDTDVGETAMRRWVGQLRAGQGESGTGWPPTLEQQRMQQLETEKRTLREGNALLESLGLFRPGGEMMHRCVIDPSLIEEVGR